MNVIKKVVTLLLLLMIAGAGFAFVNEFSVEMSIPPQQEITLEYGEQYEPAEVTAILTGRYFLKEGYPIPVSQSQTHDLTTLGTYTDTYKAKVLWYTGTAVIILNIVDTTPPSIELVTSPDHYTMPGEPYQEEGYSAVDGYDGDLTNKVQTREENGIVYYTVVDSQGNSVTVTREIRYMDVNPPVITLIGNQDITLRVGDSYKEEGYTAEDDIDGNLTEMVTVEGTADTSKAGTYQITYRVADKFGNETAVTRVIRVKPALQNNEKNPGDKVVYLTFDDGPGKYTDDLLKVLAKYNVKATFFVTNQFPSWQKELKKEAEAGHTVAVHSYTHEFSKIYKSEEAFYNDVDQMAEIIRKQTGVTPDILRFPGGTSNKVSRKYCTGIMTVLAGSCEDHGYRYCDWNVDSNDAGGAKTSAEVASNVIAGIQKHNVSYVLQHDIKKFSVDAVEEIITWGLEHGYTFLPLTASSPMNHHHLNN